MENSMKEFINEIDKSLNKIYKGDILKGKVLSVKDNDVLVNINFMYDGIIYKNEVCNEDENLKEFINEGEEIEVYVLGINESEGHVLLSKKKADAIKSLDKIEEAYKNNDVIIATTMEVVKGGIIADVDGIRAFIPASQVSNEYVKDLSKFINKKFNVKVIEFNKENNKIVLSRRIVLDEEKEKKSNDLWNSLKKGEKRKGIVSRLVNFGAFVDLGGVDGLIHLNDLSWKRIMKPSDVVSIGDEVEVYLLDFDRDKNRISLALKDIDYNPWNDIESKFSTGDIVEGKVVKFMNFGAFVEIADGVEGLVHISEISEENITKPQDKLSLGEIVKVKILNVDKNRISLSIKETIEGPKEDYEKYNDDSDVTLGDVFKDALKNFKFD
ncbi:S1 RNA binding domain protein [Clostridium argentinense CDC 2741]|uniref:S1 RNA binding domain protein n=1 Tax=Clostridium argentinense CDC 2741 TaxID=1418104 RepID=A0A0C1UG56_9CLOT|nr:30S ribosomal protein S1 [Clostridium argentinense]KIE46380.1 S1 RNA binding domain protein [Clostridium argentinense CDC 2741]